MASETLRLCRLRHAARPGLALWLALTLALPVSAGAQGLPSGTGAAGSFPAGSEMEAPVERHEAPRVLRELWAYPSLAIVEPRNGAIVTQLNPPVVITFRDARDAIDLASLRVSINGIDRTREFQVSSTGAVWRPQASRELDAARERAVERAGAGAGAVSTRTPAAEEQQPTFQEGQNTIVASIRNLAGNVATTSASFVLDTTTLLTGRVVPRSPLEQAFLQPPGTASFDSVRRATPASPAISRDLVQFGYDAFRTLIPSQAPAANLPLDPSYTLGSGDTLVLYVWNVPGAALFDSAPLVVDRTGAVFVPRVGVVPVHGLTLAQAQEALRGKMARYYSGFELKLTIADLRAISVYVMGEVARPGSYSVSPFSTVLDVLVAAGGPSKMGSLRRVQLTRGSAVVAEMDAYEFLLRGSRPNGVTLQTGDTIFIPPIGPVAGITGEVKRAAIYELRPGTTLNGLLAMAGGPLPTAGLARVQIERLQSGKGRIVLDLPFVSDAGSGGSEVIQDGDLVTVFPGSDRLENSVSVEGFVRTPGVYEWKPGMRITDLLTPELLLPEAYRERVEVARLRPDFSREILHVNLLEAWQAPGGPAAVLLQPLDKISVQSEVSGAMSVTLSGEVKRPGVYVITRGERLSSLLRRAGGFTAEAFPKGGVFTRASIRERERAQLDKFVQAQYQAILADSAATAAGAAEVAGQAAYVGAQASIVAQQRELLKSLAAGVTLGRLAIHLEGADRLEGTADDILLENGDTLHVPQAPTSVLVAGAVRNSTSILWKDKQKLDYYLNRAGGATREADRDQIYILKADGSAVASFVKVRAIEPGDAIIVPLSTEPRLRTLPLIKDIATILGSFALPAAAIYGILK